MAASIPLLAQLLYEAAMKEIALHPQDYLEITHECRLRPWRELDDWERLLMISALRRLLSTHSLRIIEVDHSD